MKSKIFRIALLIMLVLSAIFCFSACDELEDLKSDIVDGIITDIENGSAQDKFNDLFTDYLVDYYIDWGDGGAAHEYTTSAELDEASHNWLEGTPVKIPHHDFKGVYTEPNGGGELIFGASGNLVSDTLVNNVIYYAYWAPRKITIEFRIDEGDVLEGYTFLNGTTVQHRTLLPNEYLNVDFPEIVGEMPVLGWSAGKTHVADGNVWSPAYQKVSDLPFEGAKNGILTLTPEFQHYNCFLTLDWGNRVEEIEVPYGDYLGDYVDYETFAGMELVGWATDRRETSDFANGYERIFEDVTYYAIWKYYRPVTLHNVTADEIGGQLHLVGDDAIGKHVYQYEPYFLPTPEREGYAFLGWYDNPRFEGEPVKRTVSYGDSTSDYYAKWMKLAYHIRIKFVQNYQTEIMSFVVSLQEDGSYWIDYSFIDYDGKEDPNKLLVGLSMHGKMQFNSEGKWIGAYSIDDSIYNYYEMEIVEKTYQIEIIYYHPITGTVGETIYLTAAYTEDGVYKIIDGDKMPVNQWSYVHGYYLKTGGKLIEVFDADGNYKLVDKGLQPEKYPTLTAVYGGVNMEVRFEIPEGFLLEGETEYLPVYTVTTTYLNYVNIIDYVLVPTSEESGEFVGWYYEYTDENGDTVRVDGKRQIKIVERNVDILYDEEKQVYYIVIKADIQPPSAGGGSETEGGEGV